MAKDCVKVINVLFYLVVAILLFLVALSAISTFVQVISLVKSCQV